LPRFTKRLRMFRRAPIRSMTDTPLPQVPFQQCLNGHSVHSLEKSYCPKCHEPLISACRKCGNSPILLARDYSPQSQHYGEPLLSREYCPNCHNLYDWAVRWLFEPRKALLEDFSDYEQRLVPFVEGAPTLVEYGLDETEVRSKHAVRPLLAWLSRGRLGTVTIDDPRHPKHENWKSYSYACRAFVGDQRLGVALKREEQRKQETFWRTLTGPQFETELGRLLQHRGYRVDALADRETPESIWCFIRTAVE